MAVTALKCVQARLEGRSVRLVALVLGFRV